MPMKGKNQRTRKRWFHDRHEFSCRCVLISCSIIILLLLLLLLLYHNVWGGKPSGTPAVWVWAPAHRQLQCICSVERALVSTGREPPRALYLVLSTTGITSPAPVSTTDFKPLIQKISHLPYNGCPGLLRDGYDEEFHYSVLSMIVNDKQSSSKLIIASRFYTGQQAANLAVLYVARSTYLDRKWYIGSLFWSANMTLRRVHFLPPPLLSKSKSSMCRQLREVGRGVDDMHCCATHSRGVLKPRNSWSQQSVHHFIHRRQDEQLHSRWDPGDASVSSDSVAVWLSAFTWLQMCCLFYLKGATFWVHNGFIMLKIWHLVSEGLDQLSL